MYTPVLIQNKQPDFYITYKTLGGTAYTVKVTEKYYQRLEEGMVVEENEVLVHELMKKQ